MKTNYRIIVLSLIALLMGMQEGWGQSNINEVPQSSFDNAYQNITISHRIAKWATGQDGWTSNKNTSPETQIQAAHVYVDTIYMLKGTALDISLPFYATNIGGTSNSYQRWYNYRTEGTFQTNNNQDILYRSNIMPYRFKNGYMGQPKGSSVTQMRFYYPSDAEYQNDANGIKSMNPDNDLYIIACDVSNYTDYENALTNDGGSFTEPTLTHRALIYVYGVQNTDTDSGKSAFEKAMDSSDFQGGTGDGKYWEEYEITFPSIRFSNHTKDGIALSKDAFAWAIPFSPNRVLPVNVRLVENSARISLQTNSLSRNDRMILFAYPGDNGSNKGPFRVEDSKTATILVTKTVNGTTYNLARYKLTFKDGFQQLTQSQVKQLDENAVAADSWWKNYGYRTQNYLEQNYRRLAQLGFDTFEPNSNNYSSRPLNWEDCSYGFFDGTRNGSGYIGKSWPDAAGYGITKRGGWYPQDETKLLPGSTAHMYIDASDRPGLIARLPIETQLCSGSELFVSAWVKSGCNDKGVDPQMLFTILGVTGDDKQVPVYRYSTGAIQRTVYVNRSEPGLPDNEWYQVYFSFVNHDNSYAKYLLQIENNSTSTRGGDMYLDDIRVYVAAPQVNAIQHKALCNQTKNPHVQVLFDWEQISALTAG